MYPLKFAVAILVYCLSTTFAFGVHLDILAFEDDGKIGVGEYDYDNLVASDKRVHLATFDSTYAVNNPGFTTYSGADPLPGSTDLGWDYLPMTIDSGTHAGYRSNLLYWDGTGTPDFGPTPTDDYELSIFGRYGPATADGSSEIVTGDVIDKTDADGFLHKHRFYFLDDNGDGLNTTLPAAGIYLIGMRLTIDGLESSDPFFIVWATPELSVLPAIQPAGAWVNERVDTLFVDGVPGDMDYDNDVDGSDFLAWQRNPDSHGGAGALADWQSHYGTNNGASSVTSMVPEPDSLTALTIILCLGQLYVRRRLRGSQRLTKHTELSSSF